MTKITGIDLGLAKMGVVTLDIYDDKIMGEPFTRLRVSKKGDMSDDGRFVMMCDSMLEAIKSDNPEIVVCEYPYGVIGNGRILIEMYGVVRRHCFRHAIPFIPVAQTTLKKYATGSGKAEKEAMQSQLKEEFGLDYGKDEADAYWLAHLGYSIRYRTGTKERLIIAETLETKHLKGG